MPFTPQMRDLSWLLARPIAHRGLHQKKHGILENTPSAFSGAMAQNYAIECDLQISADGEAMVFHDETLDRLTTQTGLLKARTRKTLQTIELKNSTDHMQTLGELLDQVQGRVPLVIELKTHWDGDVALVQRALKVLEPYGGPYALMSFDPDLVAALAELSPQTVRGITADRGVDPYYDMLPPVRRSELQQFSHVARTRPHFTSFRFQDLPFAPLQALRDHGHTLITWTIRSPEQEQTARRYSDQITFEGFAA
jgi:glycerophosphoryl diester phosphodiesterase